jgi:hypothetical protein
MSAPPVDRESEQEVEDEFERAEDYLVRVGFRNTSVAAFVCFFTLRDAHQFHQMAALYSRDLMHYIK